jgi:hypothetical protein
MDKVTTKVTASKHSRKILHQQNSLHSPPLKRVKKLHQLGHHMELGQEATLKKHKLSLNA